IITSKQSLVDHLSRQHSALDGGVNSLQSLRVEEACGIADQKHSISIHARHRKVTAGGDRLCSVTNHLAAVEKARNVWVSFESLKLGVWIDERIFVIESGDVADIQHTILHSVDPAATVC